MTPFGAGWVYFDEVTTMRDVRIMLSERPECTITACVQWPVGPNVFSALVAPSDAPEPKAQRRDWYRQFERSARHRRR